MADEKVVWTAAGKDALAAEYQRGEPICVDKDVKKLVAALIKKYAPSWKAGVAKSDAMGKAAIAWAVKFKPGAKATAEQLGGLFSLVSGNSDDAYAPVVELIVREYGFDVAFEALVVVWRQLATYSGKKKVVTWLTAMADDHEHVHDTSMASGKWEFTNYLSRRHREGSAADRAAMKKAVDALWKTAPPQARIAFAVATNDPKRAAQVTKAQLEHDEPHAFYGWQELPHVLTDPELVAAALAKRDEGLSCRIVANLGVDALPLFEARMAERIDKYYRTRVLGMLANIRSMTTARILAEYAEQAPYTDVVRTYFTLHRDHLDQVMADPEMRYYLDELVVMKNALGT